MVKYRREYRDENGKRVRAKGERVYQVTEAKTPVLRRNYKLLFGETEVEVPCVLKRDNLAVWQGDMIIGRVDGYGNLIDEFESRKRVLYTSDDEVIEQPKKAYDRRGRLYSIPEPPDPTGDQETLDNLGLETKAVGVVTSSRLAGRRWYSRTIPYRIDSNVPPQMEANIKSVFEEIKQKVGFHFWETGCSPGSSVRNNYILFKYDPNLGPRGQSWVGRAPWGATEITIRDYGKGTLRHEVGHALGLFHEHSRPNRDDYVDIQWDNIKSDEEQFNIGPFDKLGGVEMFGSYDYHSIMYYTACASAKKKEQCEEDIESGITTNATIVPHSIDMLTVIGQPKKGNLHREFSDKDIEALKEMYDEAKDNCGVGYVQAGSKEVCDSFVDVCRYGADVCEKLTEPVCLSSSKEKCISSERACKSWVRLGWLGDQIRKGWRTVCSAWIFICHKWQYVSCRFSCDFTAKICDGIPSIVDVCIPDPTSTCH